MATDLTTATSVDLAALTVDDLRRQLAEQIEITAGHVARMARIWQELERRGEDLSALRTGIGSYLSAVATGRLIPEAVVRLAGNRVALRAVSLLRPDEQRRLLTVGSVSVLRGDASTEVPIHHLTASDVGRAFDTVNGVVRSIADQRPARRVARTRPERRIVLMLTRAEHDKLQAEARAAGRSASAFVLQVLRNESAI